jgi:hypothetical protein
MVLRERINFCYEKNVFLCERTKKLSCNAQSYNYFLQNLLVGMYFPFKEQKKKNAEIF